MLTKLTGPDGRRASLDVKLTLLQTLGGLAQPSSGNSQVYPEVLKNFMDIVSSEGEFSRSYFCIREDLKSHYVNVFPLRQ